MGLPVPEVYHENSWNIFLNRIGFLISRNVSLVPPVPTMVISPYPRILPRMDWYTFTLSIFVIFISRVCREINPVFIMILRLVMTNSSVHIQIRGRMNRENKDLKDMNIIQWYFASYSTLSSLIKLLLTYCPIWWFVFDYCGYNKDDGQENDGYHQVLCIIGRHNE